MERIVGWDQAQEDYDILFIWKKVRDMYSTASNSANPIVRSFTALDVFERTRQDKDKTLAMYINHFRMNFERMSDAHQNAYTELEKVHRFVKKLDNVRFARFVEFYDHEMDKNTPPYANMDEVMEAATAADAKLGAYKRKEPDEGATKPKPDEGETGPDNAFPITEPPNKQYRRNGGAGGGGYRGNGGAGGGGGYRGNGRAGGGNGYRGNGRAGGGNGYRGNGGAGGGFGYNSDDSSEEY
jgi:hypothetical protein